MKSCFLQIRYICAMTSMQEAEIRMNELGEKGVPFLFVIDFLMLKPLVLPLSEIDPANILFSISEHTNTSTTENSFSKPFDFSFDPVDDQKYTTAFDEVMFHLHRGDSYLLNLTMPVAIKTTLSLFDIFLRSHAPYRLWIKDLFTVFSPEPFVKISDGRIFTFPMKGTIDAEMQDAEKCLLDDKKELAEHYTIVDLLRNDLNMVATEVRVDRFRYVETIETHRGKLLQTSSVISGKLPENPFSQIGTILTTLLPAGSISGAPKKKTIEIIRKAETYERGYYTGVFGIFDGKQLNSAVMIRFIEQTEAGLIFKAGGGITVNSKCESEYQELLDKVYLPII
jgi:para-aminobenzoate synthetase component 1